MKGMTLIVKTITALLIGFITLFGFYIVLTGHISPGGGFAGGVILAAGLLLVILAFGALIQLDAARAYVERHHRWEDQLRVLQEVLG